ncbi:MAG: NUDIX domain-containing protein [Rhizomicrobium sp.]
MRQFAFRAMITVRALLTPVAFGAHAMIFDRDGKVLLARHTYFGALSFPGGGVGRGEPAEAALMRELREELGGLRADPPVFVGLFTHRAGWATNLIALYRLTNAEVEFRPNAEISEIMFVDPADPPAGTSSGSVRRLAEYLAGAPPNPYW